MDIWKELQAWYTKHGISTEQFFSGNSTEMGRDEMLMDFAVRMLEKENKPARPLTLSHATPEELEGLPE
jgi:hypothetical protein